MYYYLENANYYKCKDGRSKKCSKRGKYSTGRSKCNSESVARIEKDNIPLEAELQNLVNPPPSVVVLPSLQNS